MDVLVSRNALAEGEAKYLSEFNAHLLGHANLNQRIFYVDRLRKEMSELKQVRFLKGHKIFPRPYLTLPLVSISTLLSVETSDGRMGTRDGR